MRNLEECKREIFRRSKERIEKRKRTRKCILGMGISLCLVMFLRFAMLPFMIKSGDREMANKVEDIISETSNEAASRVCTYDMVEIRAHSYAGKYERKVTDKVEIVRIFDTICSFPYDSEAKSKVELEWEYKEDVTEIPKEQIEELIPTEQIEEPIPTEQIKPEDDSQKPEYSIIFSTAKGESVTYILAGNMLRNESSGEMWLLTDVQVLELKTLLRLEL